MKGESNVSLAKRCGFRESAIRTVLDGKMPGLEKAAVLARALDVSLEWLATGKEPSRQHTGMRESVEAYEAQTDLTLINELDVRAAAGENGSLIEILEGQEDEHTKGSYGFPANRIHELFGAPATNLRILSVVGDSMLPLLMPGQPVVVDIRDRGPSPDGIFVLWNGAAVVIKHVQYIDHSDPPAIRISSANPAYQAYERTVDEAHILGRVVGRWTRS